MFERYIHLKSERVMYVRYRDNKWSKDVRTDRETMETLFCVVVKQQN